MPFKQVDVKKIVREKIQQDPDFRKEYHKIKEEYHLIDQVKKARQSSGMTQKELAKKVGVSQQVISRFENEKHVPKLDNFLKILSGLDLELSIKKKNRCEDYQNVQKQLYENQSMDQVFREAEKNWEE